MYVTLYQGFKLFDSYVCIVRIALKFLGMSHAMMRFACFAMNLISRYGISNDLCALVKEQQNNHLLLLLIYLKNNYFQC